jgi:NADH-quinone oxidoreductase subunit H
VVLYVAGGVIAVLLLSVLFDMLRPKKAKPGEVPIGGPAAFDPMAGGFPVPPMPGQPLPVVPRRPSRVQALEAESTTVPALKGDDGA